MLACTLADPTKNSSLEQCTFHAVTSSGEFWDKIYDTIDKDRETRSCLTRTCDAVQENEESVVDSWSNSRGCLHARLSRGLDKINRELMKLAFRVAWLRNL